MIEQFDLFEKPLENKSKQEIIHGDCLDKKIENIYGECYTNPLKKGLKMPKISELQMGKAGEYLVCADLILKGYTAFPSEQGLHYDVVVDANNRLIRIQVKTTETFRATPQRRKFTPSYLFNCRRCGKGGRHSYANHDLDIMALICLEDKLIAYLPIHEVKQTMQFRVRKYDYKTTKGTERYLDDFPFEKALDSLLACKELQINAIGIEKELEYYNIAKERVKNW